MSVQSVEPFQWLCEVEQMAVDTFESESEALLWLRRPHPMLDGEMPLEAARTACGAQRVKDILLAIQRGGVA
ncbi:MbcA/ParS/Xre antitoxin family protein [uncultured Sphaerotilus sp.]|uniref:MbcA/ParS/Xre antitoxin family protein n=1 Tax=uncultured Sphaerotilus sp. TaxID=474984 RepID=UPI0030CA51C9